VPTQAFECDAGRSLLTVSQLSASDKVIAGPARHILGRGGARSGKTFLFCRATMIRALKAPESRHAIVRKHFNHLKPSIIYDTMPKVARLCFPGLRLRLNKSDWFHELPGGQQIWYGGLDDAERTEKILGTEFATIFLNEASQISYDSRNKMTTRLAQRVKMVNGEYLPLKAYYDCNPPGRGHWSYQLWFKKIEPKSRKPLRNPDAFATFQMNPRDNEANLPPETIEELQSLPEKDRLRFWDGEYQSEIEGALWDIDAIQRVAEIVSDDDVIRLRDRMRRIVVAIDPSGASGPEDTRNDEIGISVSGVDAKGNGYVIEDATDLLSPERWATKAIGLYDKWQADTIIGEVNYGGDMVRAVVQGQRKSIPFKKITASRGKHVRAEPVAALYDRKREDRGFPIVKHVGSLVDLEDEYSNFSTAGYMGERSPNRADASIFGLTELMLDPNQKRAGVLW